MQEKLRRLASFYEFDTKDVLSMADDSATIHIFLSKLMSAFIFVLERNAGRRKRQATSSIWTGSFPDGRTRRSCVSFAIRRTSTRPCGRKEWDSVEEFTERWCSIVGAVEGFRDKLDLGPDRYFEVRYEALIADPLATTQKLFEFFDEAMERGRCPLWRKDR